MTKSKRKHRLNFIRGNHFFNSSHENQFPVKTTQNQSFRAFGMNFKPILTFKSFFIAYTYLLIIPLWLYSCGATSKKEETASTKTQPTAVLMAESEIKRNPDPRYLDFRTTPKWEYSNGLVCLAMLKVWEHTQEDKFLNYVRFYTDSMIQVDGSIKTYKETDYNIDRINSGKLLFKLLDIDQKPKYAKAIEVLRQQLANQPKTSEGGFWHKKIYPNQMWLDGLYMGSPFLAEYAFRFNEPALFDQIALQFDLINKHHYDAQAGLYYHGWDESKEQKWAHPDTGVSPEFWGRAMGWLAMACVDVLDYFPEDHPGRAAIMQTVTNIASGIRAVQDPQRGTWYQILDKGDWEGNYLEASCSSMFTYFLAKAVQKGYLDKSYQQVAEKAYEGVLRDFVKTNEKGELDLTQICGVAGLGGHPYRDGTYEYYISEMIRPNDPKGIGPFIMASLLMEGD